MVRLRPVVAALAAAALLALLLALRAGREAPVRVLALPAPGASAPAAPTAPAVPAAPTASAASAGSAGSTGSGTTRAPSAARDPADAAARAATGATPSGPAAPPDVRAVFAALDRARTAAFADPARGDPGAWAVPACSCHADDARRLRDLARDGLALRGHAPELLSVVRTRAGPHSLGLLVTDRLGPYAAVDRRGRTVARWPGSGERRWRVTLVRASGQWRIRALARAP